MDPVKQIELTIQELDASIEDIPENNDMKSFLKEFYTSPALLNVMGTGVEAAPGPPPPPFIPPLPVFNVYPQTVVNLNTADAAYMEAAPHPPPPTVVPTPPVFNSYSATVGNLNTADAVYMEAAPRPPPPPVVPAQQVFNSYSGIVGNLNTADALYMEAASAPPAIVPAQQMFNSYPQAMGNLHTADALYMESGPGPPTVVPAQQMFNSYPQTVGNLNTANALYMESGPGPSTVGAAQPMFNIYPQTVGNLTTANAVYMESAPTPQTQLIAPPVYSQVPPSVYSQAAPSVYSQSGSSVYSQSAPSVYSQTASVFHQSYGQNTMQPGGHLYNQAVAQSQGQYLPYQQQVFNNQRAPSGCAPPQQYMQMWMPGQDMKLPVVGVLNGEVVYGMTPGANSSSFASAPTKKKKQLKLEDQEPYIRRPPNAFMLYLKEQRPNVMTEVKSRSSDTINSARVNAILGQKWKSLTKVEQDKYYHEANRQREYHCLLHPGWSPGQNYGKKRKRIRKKAPKMIEGSEYESMAVEVKQAPIQPQLMGPPIPQTPPVTVPHIFSLHPQSFNPVPPQHHLQPSTHTIDPVFPKP